MYSIQKLFKKKRDMKNKEKEKIGPSGNFLFFCKIKKEEYKIIRTKSMKNVFAHTYAYNVYILRGVIYLNSINLKL